MRVYYQSEIGNVWKTQVQRWIREKQGKIINFPVHLSK